MKRTLKIFTGQPFKKEDQPNVSVIFDKPLPEYKDSGNWQEEYEKAFSSEAEKLEQVLIDCLPGGTYDRLLTKMLERKHSQLIVKHEVKK